ncbi:MAG: peptidase, partial [Gammaproteobacteria bacterium]
NQAKVLVAQPSSTPRLAPRTIPAQNAYLMTSMLHSVITHGTGQAARSLGRDDLAGKTGTTNDFSNAWFDGFGPRLVAVTWVGYDQPHSLGYGETGARAALPMWIDFMGAALKGVPEAPASMPPNLVTVRIDSKTGLRCNADDPNAIWETFRSGNLPPLNQTQQAPSLYGGGGGTGGGP